MDMITYFLEKTRIFWQRIVILVTIAGFTLTNGCTDYKKKNEDEYLIRVGENIVTVIDFHKALEIAKIAYSHNAMQDSETSKAVQLRLLNQMTEEVVLCKKADELNITISEPELEKTIADIKTDYPEGVFEQMLLESAVSYLSWKKRLKIRLIMEKVIAQELENNITITPEEISKYYKEQFKDKTVNLGIEGEPEDIDELIIKNLRRRKAEEAYAEWIKSIQKEYIIEINKEQWEKIIEQ